MRSELPSSGLDVSGLAAAGGDRAGAGPDFALGKPGSISENTPSIVPAERTQGCGWYSGNGVVPPGPLHPDSAAVGRRLVR
jgi:hypothetical protein